MDETNKKCCGFWKSFLVIILLLNTFFIGSIWCTLKYGYGGKASFCPFGMKGKVCPITGKSLDEYKGSMMGETQKSTP